jgi:hypothetical protein
VTTLPSGVYLDEMFGPAMQQHMRTRLGATNAQIVLAEKEHPAARDSVHLARAARQGWCLVTRNVQDFVWLHERWITLRDWGVLGEPHAGILIALGSISDLEFANQVVDLLLHPGCPPLADQLLFWHAAAGRWEADHPYSSRRRRPVSL